MIQSEYDPVITVGNGVATTFPFTWKVAHEDFLVATLVDVATEIETVLVLDTDYSITGVGEDAGGSVTYPLSGDPMPSTKKLVLSLDIPPLQEVAFGDQGGFFPLTHERAFDKVTQILQVFRETLARCVKVTIVSEDDPDTLIATLNADVVAAAAAKTAAEAAQAAAEAAQAAAEAGQTGAENAQLAAETAQGLAQTAQTNAETAETNAETAQTAAEAAQGLAEAAKTAAETAQGLAEAAQSAAEVAKADAIAAQAAAETAETNAETAETNAETAETNAETAQAAAEAAQTAAEAAQAAAEAAATAFTKASQAEAEAGTEDTKFMTPLKVDQAIQARKIRVASLSVSGGAVATDAAVADVFDVTPNASFTLSNPTNGQDGQAIVWRIKQDATGSRVITLGNKFRVSSEIAAVVLSTAANAIDHLGARYNSADDKWDVEAFSTVFA